MLTIACVYKPGNGFTAEYVKRLQAGVREHCKRSYQFVCLTNERVERVDCIPLRRGWTGFWNKLELFSPKLFNGPVAYFDLDTMLVGDITDMVETEHPFASLTHWTHPHIMASGVMVWDGRVDFSHIPASYSPMMNEAYQRSAEKNGDQAFIQERVGGFADLNKLFPGRIVSYKLHVRRLGYVPAGASIVAFHGRPRPADIEWRLPDVRSSDGDCAVRGELQGPAVSDGRRATARG